MTDFIMFAGPNGSGKSTVRDAVTNPAEVVIDPDRIARELNPSDPKSVEGQAGREAIRRFEAALEGGRSLSMETTLTGHTAVQRLRRAKDAGYDVSLIFVALDNQELNVGRVAERVRSGGHHIPPELTRKRVAISIGNLPAALAIADQAIVLDNSGKSHRPVMEIMDQRVTFLADKLPTWLEASMPDILAKLRPADLQVTKPQRAMTNIFSALRKPVATTDAPWATPAVSMIDRLATYQKRGAEAATTRLNDPDLDPKPDIAPRPSTGPKL